MQIGTGCVPVHGPRGSPNLACGTLFIDGILPSAETFTWRQALALIPRRFPGGRAGD